MKKACAGPRLTQPEILSCSCYVSGAIEAAGTIGTTALKAVREMLVGVVEGVRGVASAALPKTPPDRKN